LAIRERKIYVLGEPRLDVGHTPVYLDVEGIPDLAFYYLIGASYSRDGELVHAAFWVNDPSEERLAWKSFLAFLSELDRPKLVHYGSYEKQFLRDMSERYSEDTPDQAFVSHLVEASCNVLSAVFSHLYFPTYSNGLKEIAGVLAFRWTDPSMSGALASVRRLRWEQTRNPDIKRGLIEYNADDCRALVELSKALSAIAARAPQPGVVPVSTAMATRNFYRREFATPEFAKINEAAYWDHQRDLVYVRSRRRRAAR
jgi:predicted RecB family nuclease